MILKSIVLSILIVAITSIDEMGNEVKVNYASLIKLVNPAYNLFVHSHDVFFGRGGVMSVTGYRVDDVGSFWQISEKHQSHTKTYKDAVRCGDAITLSSALVGYYLRVEETQFGLTTELIPIVHGMTKDNIDQKINFRIHCVQKHQGDDIHFNDKVRFKHEVTGKYVSMDEGFVYNEANCGRGCSIQGQLQMHAIDHSDEATTIFQIKTGLAYDPNFVGKVE